MNQHTIGQRRLPSALEAIRVIKEADEEEIRRTAENAIANEINPIDYRTNAITDEQRQAEAKAAADERRKAEATEAAARHKNEGFADATEAVARARSRQGRKVCSPHDAKAILDIAQILQAIQPATGGSDNDPAWGGA